MDYLLRQQYLLQEVVRLTLEVDIAEAVKSARHAEDNAFLPDALFDEECGDTVFVSYALWFESILSDCGDDTNINMKISAIV